MSTKLDKLKKILEKARQINGDVSLAKELIELEEKIADKEVIEVKVVHELRGKDGKDGEDYKLTDKDKKEIADSITVPVVEKVIEKVETIIEQPIINSETIEVENDETGEEIVEKINDLSVQDDKYKIDASHIKNLPIGKGGGGSTARNFYQLFDTPENYAGAGGYKVKVKSDESGLEFLADSGGGSWDKPYGSATFTYDIDGNIETKLVGDTELTYAYDVDGNVESITNGTYTKSFVYNVDGDVEAINYS